MADPTEALAPASRRSVADKVGMGSPARTLALRHEFRAYKEEGGEQQWKEWLESRGYGADQNGNAYLKDDS